MIMEEENYLEHYGKKGMRWGTRKENKAVANALTAKAHRERLKYHSKNAKGTAELAMATDRLVAKALANPKAKIHIIGNDSRLTVNGADFAEVVIGRIGRLRLDPFAQPLQRVTVHKPGRG